MSAESDALGYATRLACSMWGKHYREEAPNWHPFDHLMGVLTQIDNMTTGLTKKTEVATPDLLQMLHECAEYIAALNGEQDDYCQRARALIARATGEAK